MGLDVQRGIVLQSNEAFHTAPIHAEGWVRIAAVGAAAQGVAALEAWLHAAKAR